MGIGASVSYVHGRELSPWVSGSYEEIMRGIAESVARVAGSGVEVIATKHGGALFLTPDGLLHEASIAEDGTVEVKDSNIKMYGDDDMPVLVSNELRDIVSEMLDGNTVDPKRLNALSSVIDEGEDYWLSEVLAQLDESLESEDEDGWQSFYAANQEKIRTSLWGSIREIEGKIPKTSYSKIAHEKLVEFEPELRESLSLVNGAIGNIIDTTSSLVFHEDDELFFGAIRDSLIEEARLLEGLLAKAEKLMREENVGRMAVAHDRLCGRAKTIGVVSAYLTGRAKKERD